MQKKKQTKKQTQNHSQYLCILFFLQCINTIVAGLKKKIKQIMTQELEHIHFFFTIYIYLLLVKTFIHQLNR